MRRMRALQKRDEYYTGPRVEERGKELPAPLRLQRCAARAGCWRAWKAPTDGFRRRLTAFLKGFRVFELWDEFRAFDCICEGLRMFDVYDGLQHR